MTTFRPNTTCRYKNRLSNEWDINGQPLFGCWFKAKCAVIYLEGAAEPTSVRADSSGTRGKAEEKLYDARLMFDIRADIAIGDIVDVRGYRLEIVSIHPRWDVNGDHHHNQVDLIRWVERATD